MNILMITNTYAPTVGGLERSVESFTREYRRLGHRVIIAAPGHADVPAFEEDVIRLPAIHRFRGTDYSVHLPIPGALARLLGGFRPDIVHTHHPFLLGDTALRLAYAHRLPIVFTHHTLYEQNTHYVFSDSLLFKRFVIELSTGFANLTDRVFAPSPSVKRLLIERGVRAPVDVVPTGADLDLFRAADGARGRRAVGLPPDAFVAGYAGRLAVEKNLEFLSRAAAHFLEGHPKAFFLVMGDGPLQKKLRHFFLRRRLSRRAVFTGNLGEKALADAYAAMDVFAFASQSETQGLVLVEAMACGVPVVAHDACAVRDVVRNGVNGRLLPIGTPEAFSEALSWTAAEGIRRKRLAAEARRTAARFGMERCARRALGIYARLVRQRKRARRPAGGGEWNLLSLWTGATAKSIRKKTVLS